MRNTIITGLAVATLAAAGCASDPYDVSYDAITSNLSPELMTLDERPVDVDRHMAYTNDLNGRMFWEDLGRVWYTGHPSRLNPVEIPGVSGKPR